MKIIQIKAGKTYRTALGGTFKVLAIDDSGHCHVEGVWAVRWMPIYAAAILAKEEDEQ